MALGTTVRAAWALVRRVAGTTAAVVYERVLDLLRDGTTRRRAYALFAVRVSYFPYGFSKVFLKPFLKANTLHPRILGRNSCSQSFVGARKLPFQPGHPGVVPAGSGTVFNY